MENQSDTHKVSDSGYSNSCSNSQSQRSGSSNSRKSGRHSSRSSGYCGHQSTANSSEAATQPKRNKDGEHKKKKLKSSNSVHGSQPETKEIIQTVATVIEAEVAKEVIPNETTEVNVNAVNNVVSCFVPVISPLLTTVIETDVGVLTTATPQASPRTPKTADPVQKDENSLPNWEGEPSTEKPRKDLIETAEAILDESIPNDSATKTFTCQPEDGFCFVISMHDGLVLYTTPSLTAVLGFPKDMWLGRSFIEFVQQKDRETFANQIALELAEPLSDSSKRNRELRNPLFVNLRKYRGLSSGYGVVENSVTYQPFQLSIRVRHVNDPNDPHYVDDSHGVFLVVVAIPVHSFYKVPNEKCKTSKFSTRHTANCTISHVDQKVVQSFGFFPQDMLGRSILDFYHPEDMPLIKEVYETVMVRCKTAGAVFRSQPYRFAVQNGGYAVVETEWTSFVNPWTRKMEFIIGYHRILQGPQNPDVFAPRENFSHISEKILKESNSIKSDIHAILNQLIKLDSLKQQISQRCRDLATFMENILDDVSKCNLKLDILHETSVSERDSVMLGEISPHHEYCDSKSSSETPPSYNQLNYNENIQRFFLSKPMTNMTEEIAGPFLSTTDTDQEGKISTLVQDYSSNQKCLSPVQCSGASGSGSGGNLSSESNPQMENGTTSGTNFSNDSYKPPRLTESLLLKHNEDMEKIMMKKHKDQRSINKADRDGKKHHSKNLANVNAEKNGLQQGNHGIKRSGSNSWEAENHKISKHQHDSEMKTMQENEDKNETSSKQMSSVTAKKPAAKEKVESVNLWPPFSVTVTPIHTTPPCTTNMLAGSGPGYTAGMFPAMYYIPTHAGQSPYSTGQSSSPGIHNPAEHAGQYQLQYLPSMMYPTMFSTYPVLYPQVAMLQPISVPIQQTVSTSQAQQTDCGLLENDKPSPTTPISGYNVPLGPDRPTTNTNKGLFQRPASQATSVKAEPGSAVGSIASASVANRAMSECSRKDIGLQSVCSPDSPMVSSQDGELYELVNKPTKQNEDKAAIQQRTNGERSMEGDEESTSNSSFYSSFLKTDTGSGSNEDNNNPDAKTESNDNISNGTIWKKPRIYPMRNPIPPWLDNVKVTPELIYRYQMNLRELGDVLNTDLMSLKDINQPDLVDEQLNQLYLEMELEGLSTKLTLEDTTTSSSSYSSDENSKNTHKPKKKRRSYSELVMIYEEDSPMPPPISNV